MQFEAKLPSDQLAYIPHHIRARVSYMEGRYEDGLQHYCRAFNLSRYCAGKKVLGIAEEYLSLMIHLHLNEARPSAPSTTMPTINYMTKWFRLPYPEHPLSKDSKEGLEAAAKEIYGKHFAEVPEIVP